MTWYKVKHNGILLGKVEAEDGRDAISHFKAEGGTGAWQAEPAAEPTTNPRLGMNLFELAALCVLKQHQALYHELVRIKGPFQWDPEVEGTCMVTVEHLGINWMLYAQANNIIDSDMDDI